MSTSQMLNEEMVARMEELLLENMRLTVRAEDAEDEVAKLEAYMTSPKQQDQIDKLTVRAEEAEAELAEVEEEKDSWEDRAANQKDEIFQLKAWLAAAHENANVKSHDEAAGVLIEENDQLSALLERAQLSHVDQRKEIKELKAEIAQLRVVASGCQPVWPFSNWHSDAGRALGEVRDYLDRFDHDEVEVFDKIMEKECPDWLNAFKADEVAASL